MKDQDLFFKSSKKKQMRIPTINQFYLNKSRKTYKIKKTIMVIQTKPTRSQNPNQKSSKIIPEKIVKWKKLPFHRLKAHNLVSIKKLRRNRKEIFSSPILYLEQKIKAQFLSPIKYSLWSPRNKQKNSLILTNTFHTARQKIQKQRHTI